MYRRKGTTGAIVEGSAWQLLVTVSLASAFAFAQNGKTSYPKMASVNEYLMPNRSAEIALARSAAPIAISRDATVLVLGRKGYEMAVKGTNGFVCAVERSWMSPYNSSDFWNPKIRGPICFNPAAVRSILPITYARTRLVLRGHSKEQVIAAMRNGAEAKKIPRLDPGAVSYMLSSRGYLSDSDGHWLPHLMVYVSRSNGATWGANVKNSPVLSTPQFDGSSDSVTVLVIPVRNWADGTPAPHR